MKRKKQDLSLSPHLALNYLGGDINSLMLVEKFSKDHALALVKL